jgi:hypothetical protein
VTTNERTTSTAAPNLSASAVIESRLHGAIPRGDQAPRMPVRTRLLRPDIFSDDVTGTLAPATLLAYLGLGTRADDAAFLVWRPAALAAAVMPYTNSGRRQRDFERIAAELVEAGLLRILDCGCAELPRMIRDLAIGGGNKSYPVRDWHLAHLPTDSSVQVQTPTAESISSSGSSSSSESYSGLYAGPASGDGLGAGTGRAPGSNDQQWTDAHWLDQLHRLGMPFDPNVDRTWSPWLASLQPRHPDQTILHEIATVIKDGEARPSMVQELVRAALDRPARSRPGAACPPVLQGSASRIQ